MNKSVQSLFLVSCGLFASQTMNGMTKMDKLEKLANIRYNKAQLIEKLTPIFSHFFESATFADEKTKQAAKAEVCEAYCDFVKHAYIEEFGKRFKENELDELIAFYDTAVGKKFSEEALEIDTVVGNTCKGFFSTIQERIVKAGGKPQAQAPQVEAPHTCAAVIYFEELVKKSSPASVQELFEKTIAGGVCAVKISTTWCPPCRAYRPIFESVAEQYKEINACSIKYIAIDADQSPAVAQACKVSSIPATIFFKDGKEVMRYVGALSKEALVAKLQQVTQG